MDAPIDPKETPTTLSVVVGGSMISGVAWVGGKGAQFVLNVVLARELGADHFGLYGSISTVFVVVATLCSFGIASGVLRFGTKSAGVNDFDSFRRIVRMGIGIVVCASVTAGLFLWYSSDQLSAVILKESRIGPFFLIAPFALINLNLSAVLYEANRALRWVKGGSLLFMLVPPVVQLAIFLSLSQVGSTIWAAVCAFGLAPFAGLLGMGIQLLFMPSGQSSGLRENRTGLAELLSVSLRLLPVAVSGSIMMWTSILGLQILGTTKDVGVFVAAVKVAMLILIPIQALATVTTPILGKYWMNKDTDRFARGLRLSGSVVQIVVLGLVGVVVLLSGWILSELYGAVFAEGALSLALIGVGVGAVAIAQVYKELLLVGGDDRLVLREMGWLVVIDIILKVALIPPYGILGVAVASMLSQITYAWRILRLCARTFQLGVVPRRFALALCIAAMLSGLSRLIDVYVLSGAGVVVFCILFAIAAWKLLLDDETRTLVLSIPRSTYRN